MSTDPTSTVSSKVVIATTASSFARGATRIADSSLPITVVSTALIVTHRHLL